MGDTNGTGHAPFLDNPVVNAARLSLIILGVIVIMICLVIAWRRVRREHHLGTSGWWRLAVAAFAAIPTISALARFGEPFTWWKTVLYLLGLAAALFGIRADILLRYSAVPAMLRRRLRLGHRKGRRCADR